MKVCEPTRTSEGEGCGSNSSMTPRGGGGERRWPPTGLTTCVLPALPACHTAVIRPQTVINLPPRPSNIALPYGSPNTAPSTRRKLALPRPASPGPAPGPGPCPQPLVRSLGRGEARRPLLPLSARLLTEMAHFPAGWVRFILWTVLLWTACWPLIGPKPYLDGPRPGNKWRKLQ